ncbi:FAD-dependent oxidoreductase [Cognatiyoonia sp. IB215446]|uniref:flavin monoamine oxidase family protein n=1 Tax=Cognatiyoonia sp. IB215446 TaxID=3097355 RepID=UPI002A106838|nr:FAD-dependent oxidoreductase [Cognatiyoonia sp. IB215446]MDX8346915.1 FAD-dependent oxidoreductase [Cognatiyoonia sp. IB215446]
MNSFFQFLTSGLGMCRSSSYITRKTNTMKRRQLLETATAALAASFVPLSVAAAGARSPLGYIRTNWSHDPFSFGSYSFFAKGSARRHARALAEPVFDRVFFAGEATHPDYNSTVHAAYESGLIAADAVNQTGAQRICVVGAGMSGLAAASSLAKSGNDVTILEARDRIGGRIWTDEGLGAPLDLGASWIHGTEDNPLMVLAADRSVSTKPTADSFIVRGRGGRLIPDDEQPDWLDEVISIQHSAGAGSEEINGLAYVWDNDYQGDDVLFPGGYSQLFSGMTDGVALNLGAQVEQVNYNTEGTTVQLSGGTELAFDAVIVTVPLGVLKSACIRFEPPLSGSKQSAIERLGMGVLDKVYLKYDSVFWDENITWIATPENGLPQGHFNQWLNLYPYIGQPIIMAFNGGQPARDIAALPDDKVLRHAKETLDLAYPS